MAPSPPSDGAQPAWPAVERGLGAAFKALAIRVWLFLLLGFTALPPHTHNATSLIAYLTDIFGFLVFFTTVSFAVSLVNLRHAPRPARRPFELALVATLVVAAIELTRIVRATGALELDAAVVDAVVLGGRCLFVAAAVLLLEGVARTAPSLPDTSSLSGGLLRATRRGQMALLAWVILFAGTHLASVALPEARVPLGGVALAGLLGAAVLALRPLHHAANSARTLRLAASPAPVQAAPSTTLAVIEGGATTRDAADDEAGEDWIPRSERRARLGLVDAPPPVAVGAWKAAQDGLRVFAAAFTTRVVIAIFEGVVAPGGSSPYGPVAVVLVAAAAVAASAYIPIGLRRFLSVPASRARRVAKLALGLAVGMLLYDVALLGVAVIEATDAAVVESWRAVALGRNLLALATVGAAMIAAWELRRRLRSASGGARQLALALTMFLVAFVGEAVVALVYDAYDSDTRALANPMGLIAMMALSGGLILMLMAVHSAGDAMDDEVRRLHREREALG